MLTITLVRHGNTDANKKRIIQGQLGSSLNLHVRVDPSAAN